MKWIFFLSLFVIPLIAVSQTLNNSDLNTSSILTYGQTARIDSFTFCSKMYKISRDCDRKSQANCCSYNSNPDQLGCYNGTSLFWTYFKNNELAKSSFESFPTQMEKQMKLFKKETIKCILNDTECDGYRLSFKTKTGHKGNEIITYGVVNEHYVFVQLASFKELKKNKNIQPVFRQIVRLTM